MRMQRWKEVLVVVLACSSGTMALGGDIAYRVGTGPEVRVTVSNTAPYTPVEVQIVGGPGDIFTSTNVHIYDITTGGDPVDSVGMITLRGQVFGGQVKVLVAAASVTDVNAAFNDPLVPVQPGLRNLGGLQLLPVGNVSQDRSLRTNTTTSITILGDLTGDVTAGQLFRIDALRSDTAPNPLNHFGGTISGTIRSTAPDPAFSGQTQDLSIRYVRAGWQITGNIVADGLLDAQGQSLFNPANTLTWGSIDRVVVGPTLTAPGLRGDIHADNGVIERIYTTGQIGDGPEAANRSSITAGVRIGLITARAAESMPTDDAVLPRPFYAAVNASVRGGSSAINSSMSLLETDGNYEGTINVFDTVPANDSIQRHSGRKGIFIGGDFTGDINVVHNYEYADIVARSFRPRPSLGYSGSITVGRMFKGGIVAVGTHGSTDPLDGTIGAITIGYGSNSGSPRATNGFGFLGHGGGIIAPPFEGADRGAWYTVNAPDISSLGSVIRAATSIGTVHIKSMSVRLAPTTSKFGKPRVEAPTIGSLIVDDMDHGVVWSGVLDSSTSAVTDDIVNDYADIGTVQIGCMGPRADLWVKNTPLIDIQGDVFGEVHLPSLNSNQTLRIGGRFGELSQIQTTVAMCQAEYTDFDPDVIGFWDVRPFENSPRGFWSSIENNTTITGTAQYARIIVRESAGLHGQIILDANNTTASQRPSTHWNGDVLIGVSPTGTVETRISRNATRQPSFTYRAPLYRAFPENIGGGAIGLVPFAVHKQSTLFLNYLNSGTPPNPVNTRITNTEFNRYGMCVEDVQVDFYGPLLIPSTSAPIAVWLLANNGGFTHEMNIAPYVNFAMAGTQNRTLAFHSSLAFGAAPTGNYDVQSISVAAARLRCGGLLATNIPVLDFGAVIREVPFDLSFACPCSTTPCVAGAAGCTMLPSGFCDGIDFNNDGVTPDSLDIDDILSVFGGGACSNDPNCGSIDFNNDGVFPDSVDVDAFLRVFGGGPCIVPDC